MRRLRIVDVFVENDQNDVISNLLFSAFEFAKENNYALLEMIGFPEYIRDQFNTNKAFSRIIPSWPFLYRALTKNLKETLKNKATWYASPYDGDASF